MAYDFLRHASFIGPIFPEPYVQFDLENDLRRLGLIPRTTGDEGRALQESWEVYRRMLRQLVSRGGPERVRNHVIEPLIQRLGYVRMSPAAEVTTREGSESGGFLLADTNGGRLRVWATGFEEDLDAPTRRGRAYRFSPVRIAQRVLLAAGERVGLLTNGVELRILLTDPARPDSQIVLPIQTQWRVSRDVPETYVLLLALAGPAGLRAVPELAEKARLQQARVTKELRVQARQAIEGFIQAVLDHPKNQSALFAETDKAVLARHLWREGLIVVYRLLVILKLEAYDNPAQAFSFASVGLWRNTYSPSTALARHVRAALDQGAETGRLLEDGLRVLFRMFTEGFQCTELHVRPLGGALFGDSATPWLSKLDWGERACAALLDRLLWTSPTRSAGTRRRVHYGSLDIEDLGRVYEALLELEPGIATETMCRLRRQKLEVVVPVAQGEKYRPAVQNGNNPHDEADTESCDDNDLDETSNDDEPGEDDDEASETGGLKTRVDWIEEISAGRFFLRVGLGRKATGSYYTPHSFVRFLVQETLGPQIAERSPREDPNPEAILKLKVLDPAMGSGHFLVEACRFLGEKLYEACRLCDEIALEAEAKAARARTDAEKEQSLNEAVKYRRRVQDLPDPDDELVRYLPSRAPEGEESGLSQKKAEALCRRLVAVHCLYGVDKNPLAVELAKISLWLVSHAEGMPLTFLDHRLVLGDSLTGPFFEQLLTYPGSGKPIDNLFHQGLKQSLSQKLADALRSIKELEASVGISVAEIEAKKRAKNRIDEALFPFRMVARIWAISVLMGWDNKAQTQKRKGSFIQSGQDTGSRNSDDNMFSNLVEAVAKGKDISQVFSNHSFLSQILLQHEGNDDSSIKPSLPIDADSALKMHGSENVFQQTSLTSNAPACSFDLTFPEVFFPDGNPSQKAGFNVVLGNPPWKPIRRADDQFFGGLDFRYLEGKSKHEKQAIQKQILNNPIIQAAYLEYSNYFLSLDRSANRLFSVHLARVKGNLAGRGTYDSFLLFGERAYQLLDRSGRLGFVFPSAFHANEGATGIRRLYLEQMRLICCLSFENSNRLFDIHSSFKFALVVAQIPGPSSNFTCGFYLHDDNWLFSDRGERALEYSLDFVRRTGGEYLSFLELRNVPDSMIAQRCYANSCSLEDWLSDRRITISQEVNKTYASDRFTRTSELLANTQDPRNPEVLRELLTRGYLILHEGKTFHQYEDHWDERPQFIVARSSIADKPGWIEASRYFRLAFRAVASSTNERTCIYSLIPPGSVFSHSAPCERKPQVRANSQALLLLACLNSFSFDWILRQRASANLSLFILKGCPVPMTEKLLTGLMVHSALRLTCNHDGFIKLWQDQVGHNWREKEREPFTWPVLVDDHSRWEVRSVIDAAVADAYGLDRNQYDYILHSFSHASYPQALRACLEKFDELKAIGHSAFIQKYDPYWDIPLNENLPHPVLDYPCLSPHRVSEPQKLFQFVDQEESSGAEDSSLHTLLTLLKQKGVINSADAQATLNLSAAEVRPLLRRLVNEGWAVIDGQKRGTRYLFKQNC
ncbi:MAG TPA: N-6 DNA methylase [Acidobacteriota bacterium]|nr:N-6 DNA methylase [Acidobacteriota bacterium]